MQREKVIIRGAITGAMTVLMLTAAACGTDSTTAPAATGGTPTVRASANSGGMTGQTTFTVQPNREAQVSLAGGHIVQFAASSICEPRTSGYGPDTWETPCEIAHGKITVTAYSYVDADGHPFVRFSPDLRFTPDDTKPVWLALMDRSAATAGSFKIVYCPTDGTECVDEAKTDPEVETLIDRKKQFLYRRVKHFSGYNIASGTLEVTATE